MSIRDDDQRLRDIEARMRDHLTHRYFDTQHEIVADVITKDLPSLKRAVSALRIHLANAEAGQTTLDLKGQSEGK
jgi:uncharacterized protein with HEPN domain